MLHPCVSYPTVSSSISCKISIDQLHALGLQYLRALANTVLAYAETLFKPYRKIIMLPESRIFVPWGGTNYGSRLSSVGNLPINQIRPERLRNRRTHLEPLEAALGSFDHLFTPLDPCPPSQRTRTAWMFWNLIKQRNYKSFILSYLCVHLCTYTLQVEDLNG